MLLTKYIFYAILHNDLPPPTQTASTPRSYSRPFNNFHTPVFCRSATCSIETPCALFQKPGGYTPKGQIQSEVHSPANPITFFTHKQYRRNLRWRRAHYPRSGSDSQKQFAPPRI